MRPGDEKNLFEIVHKLTNSRYTAIPDLQTGVTYFALPVEGGSPGDLQVAASPGGVAIPLFPAGFTGTNTIGNEGLDLEAGTATGIHSLYVDLENSVATGLQRLIGDNASDFVSLTEDPETT